ncbi:MAG TPA: shikimate kinase I, partial [Gammaproteobacteria bacterium]|nr:shikimate kinase I [Gammaproteobacteria bacterium]
MKHRSVFLVGLMAVGKSSVGRQLADELGYSFYDSDHEV